MKVKICGSRGSIPSPLRPNQIKENIENHLKKFEKKITADKSFTASQYLDKFTLPQIGGFGGDTTCVEIVNKIDDRLIIDGGSGLRSLGFELLKGPLGKGQGECHIYLTHFHWDHLMGIPFFIPLYIPGNKVYFYAVQSELEGVIRHIFEKPYFPVPFEALGAEVTFTNLPPREPFSLGELEITPYQLDHPDPCWGARISSDQKVYAHCVDNEAIRVSRDKLGDDLPLYQGVDLMYFDAQYSFSEHMEKVDWGHASSSIGLDLAFREKIKHIIFTHHDPAASDQAISRMVRQTNDYHKMLVESLGPENIPVFEYAYDGMEIEL